jgi:hypothetical protein
MNLALPVLLSCAHEQTVAALDQMRRILQPMNTLRMLALSSGSFALDAFAGI